MQVLDAMTRWSAAMASSIVPAHSLHVQMDGWTPEAARAE